jgi:hypothetical protein
MARSLSGTLKSIFGDSIPDAERKRKWGPLAVSERIRSKLSKFENKAPIVERTMNSFDNFFKQIEKIDDNFEKTKANGQNSRMYAVPLSSGQDEDIQKVENR